MTRKHFFNITYKGNEGQFRLIETIEDNLSTYDLETIDGDLKLDMDVLESYLIVLSDTSDEKEGEEERDFKNDTLSIIYDLDRSE